MDEETKDLYAVLGLEKDKNPSFDDIKAAYRKRSKQTHPDVFPEKREEFEQIKEAYDILGDPLKKQKYDDTGDFDTNVDNMRATALQEFIGLFENIVEMVPDNAIETVNFQAIIEGEFKENMDRHEANIFGYRRKITKYEKLKTRIRKKTKGSSNFLVKKLEDNINAKNREIKESQRRIDIIKIMKEIAEDFEFTSPENMFLRVNSSYKPLKKKLLIKFDTDEEGEEDEEDKCM